MFPVASPPVTTLHCKAFSKKTISDAKKMFSQFNDKTVFLLFAFFARRFFFHCKEKIVCQEKKSCGKESKIFCHHIKENVFLASENIRE